MTSDEIHAMNMSFVRGLQDTISEADKNWFFNKKASTSEKTVVAARKVSAIKEATEPSTKTKTSSDKVTEFLNKVI